MASEVVLVVGRLDYASWTVIGTVCLDLMPMDRAAASLEHLTPEDEHELERHSKNIKHCHHVLDVSWSHGV